MSNCKLIINPVDVTVCGNIKCHDNMLWTELNKLDLEIWEEKNRERIQKVFLSSY